MVVIDQPLDAVLQDHHVEVDQQPHRNIQQPKMGEQLSVVNWVQHIFTFGFDDDSVFDH